MQSQILAEAIRGDTVESIFRGHLIVIDRGGVIASIGDPATVTFLRSSAKPFQVIPFIATGAADRYAFTKDEIALACASHSGEPMHIAIVSRMLRKIGLSESDLRCGSHQPFSEVESHRMLKAGEEPTQLHNNCSGKHTAMLGLAQHLGADIASYEAPDHPVQRAILSCVSDLTGVPIKDIGRGVDGCAAPIFAVPISNMATGFLNLIMRPDRFDAETRIACARIVSAMLDHPELIGGSARLDTLLMRAAPGSFISKVGADGVWLCAVLPCTLWPSGLAIALKVEDGDDTRARPAIAVDVLRQLGVLQPDDLPDVSPLPIKNRRGDQVGRVLSRLRLG